MKTATKPGAKRIACVGEDDPTYVARLVRGLEQLAMTARHMSVFSLRLAPRPPDLTVLLGSAAKDGGAELVDQLGNERGPFAVVMAPGALAARLEARQRGLFVVPRADTGEEMAEALAKLLEEIEAGTASPGAAPSPSQPPVALDGLDWDDDDQAETVNKPEPAWRKTPEPARPPVPPPLPKPRAQGPRTTLMGAASSWPSAPAVSLGAVTKPAPAAPDVHQAVTRPHTIDPSEREGETKTLRVPEAAEPSAEHTLDDAGIARDLARAMNEVPSVHAPSASDPDVTAPQAALFDAGGADVTARQAALDAEAARAIDASDPSPARWRPEPDAARPDALPTVRPETLAIPPAALPGGPEPSAPAPNLSPGAGAPAIPPQPSLSQPGAAPPVVPPMRPGLAEPGAPPRVAPMRPDLDAAPATPPALAQPDAAPPVLAEPGLPQPEAAAPPTLAGATSSSGAAPMIPPAQPDAGAIAPAPGAQPSAPFQPGGTMVLGPASLPSAPSPVHRPMSAAQPHAPAKKRSGTALVLGALGLLGGLMVGGAAAAYLFYDRAAAPEPFAAVDRRPTEPSAATPPFDSVATGELPAAPTAAADPNAAAEAAPAAGAAIVPASGAEPPASSPAEAAATAGDVATTEEPAAAGDVATAEEPAAVEVAAQRATPEPPAAPVAPDEALTPREARARSDVFIDEGRDHERAERFAEAAAAFTRAAEIHDLNPHAWAGLARVAMATGHPRDAIEHAERAARLRRRRPEYQVLLGDAHRAAGDAAGARRAYEEALDIDPTDETARERLGGRAPAPPSAEPSPEAASSGKPS